MIMVPKSSENLSKIDPGGALEATWEPLLKQGASNTSCLTILSNLGPPLGPVWAHFGHDLFHVFLRRLFDGIGVHLGSPNTSKMRPKSRPKPSRSHFKKNIKNMMPKMSPNWSQRGSQNGAKIIKNEVLEAPCFKGGSQVASRAPPRSILERFWDHFGTMFVSFSDIFLMIFACIL